jgi:hypothetical protein
MRFSENGLYIERYIKCGNCGVLIYEKKDQQILTHGGVTYCSQWCIDWKIAREKRRRDDAEVRGECKRRLQPLPPARGRLRGPSR